MNTEMSFEWEMLKRNIALLYSFARMADRAACRSFPFRCFMLWIFRRVEPIALNYVVDASPPLHRNSRQAIRHLAALFRAAAREMSRRLKQERRWMRRLANRDPEEPAATTPVAPYVCSHVVGTALQTDLAYPSSPRLDSS